MANILFSPGRIVSTPGALEAMRVSGVNPLTLLARHLAGDWGDICESDRRENEYSLKEGFRLLSSYTLPSGCPVWLITEADRSLTTFLLPSEY